MLTAWAQGYYIAGPVQAPSGRDQPVVIELEPHTTADHSGYEWLGARLTDDAAVACQECHSHRGGHKSLLPFDEWEQDAHGRSAGNERFLTMYRGEDVFGQRSPDTRYVLHPDYGRIPLPPDPNEPYYGPGFKLDFPGQAGNCAACHLPAAAVNAPYATEPDVVVGTGLEGVACDYCHKVWDVRLDSRTGLPYDNMPGVLSTILKRPGEERQLFIGPLDDVAPGDDTYAEVYSESRYCAPCHVARFWDVQVYNSFGEWLASSYSDPDTGKTCQDCHMPRRGARRFARKDKGGQRRDPRTIGSHLMPGAADEELLRSTAELEVAAERVGETIEVSVRVRNASAGHHMPTDSPLRNILLVLSVTDAAGVALKLVEGPTLPEWAGDLAGAPGRGYAKILEELWTEVSPSGAYWNPCRVLADTRIAAEGEDRSGYVFAGSTADATVSVQLIFRRAFQQLMEWKSWDVPDIVMAETQVTVPAP